MLEPWTREKACCCCGARIALAGDAEIELTEGVFEYGLVKVFGWRATDSGLACPLCIIEGRAKPKEFPS